MKNLLIACTLLLTLFSCNKEEAVAPNTIDSLLTTSKAAYNSASLNSWVQVTEEEYNKMATSLANVSKRGTSDANYNLANNNNLTNRTFANFQDGIAIPKDEYLFAFKYYSANNQNKSLSGRVKRSAKKKSEFISVGGALPMHTSFGGYFVLKGSNHKYNETGYLAFWADGSIAHSSVPVELSFDYNDAYKLTETMTGIAKYQGLSTPDKQW